MVAHEFHSQMKIENENMLTVYDHFRQQTNRTNELVIVTEKCEKSLHELEPFSMSTCITILLQVAHGLTAIAKKKTVHGDVKPENILLKSYGTETEMEKKRWNVRISDFGLANRQRLERLLKHNSYQMLREIAIRNLYLGFGISKWGYKNRDVKFKILGKI